MRSVSHIVALVFLALSGAADALPAAEVRAQVQRARDGAQALRHQQGRLRGELSEVAGRIQELKAQKRGQLIPGGELSSLLRRSQELSGALTEVESGLARAEGEVAQQSSALVDALDDELEAARAAFDRAGRDERRALLERMRTLRRERDQARSQLPAGQLPKVKDAPSDDPTDLLEQADALRDTQDKVAARLKALERRLSQLKRERDMDRRMGEFLGEEQTFDERDRRLATSPSTTARDPQVESTLPPSVPTVGAFSGQMMDSERSALRPRDGQPQQVGIAAGASLSGDEEMSALVKQQKELEAMSKELGARAGELEKRARELK